MCQVQCKPSQTASRSHVCSHETGYFQNLENFQFDNTDKRCDFFSEQLVLLQSWPSHLCLYLGLYLTFALVTGLAWEEMGFGVGETGSQKSPREGPG